jgi:site-specific DNA recombinase
MNTAIYARVSSDSQDVDLSISAQLRALRDFALKHGYTVVKEYVDEAESGRTALRPAFREMVTLGKAKHAPFEVILVWKLNRFARNRADSIVYKKLLRDRGIKLISINEPLEDSPSGHLLEGVIETIDEFYSENLGQDIKRGMRENAGRGFFNGSRPPYGFHKVDVIDGEKTRHRLEPDPEGSVSRQVIQLIFSQAFKGSGCKEIAKFLSKEGYLTIGGNKWGRTTVQKTLSNEAYCGTLVWGGRPGHPALRSGTPPVRVENTWPAIIDRETFDNIRQKMAGNAPQAVHPRVVPSFYLLSGLLFCSCGHAMIGRSAKSHRYYYYVCNGGYKQGKDSCTARDLPKEKLEKMVIEQLKQKVLTQEYLEDLVKLVNEELDSTHGLLKDKLDSIDAELNDVKLRLSKLYDVLETGKLNLDDLAPRIKELKSKQDVLSKARVQNEADMVVEGVQHVDAEIVKAYAEDLKILLAESDFTQSKAFLRSFVKRIVISGDKAKIQYRLPMPPDGKKIQSVGVLPIETLGGDRGIRTPDLRDANATLSRLSHIPEYTQIITYSACLASSKNQFGSQKFRVYSYLNHPGRPYQ